jgi:chromosome segregation ATPase
MSGMGFLAMERAEEAERLRADARLNATDAFNAVTGLQAELERLREFERMAAPTLHEANATIDQLRADAAVATEASALLETLMRDSYADVAEDLADANAAIDQLRRDLQTAQSCHAGLDDARRAAYQDAARLLRLRLTRWISAGSPVPLAEVLKLHSEIEAKGKAT